MKKFDVGIIISGFLIGLFLITSIGAQEGKPRARKVKKIDKKRLCSNREKQPKITNSDVPLFYKSTWGNNPQEGQYRLEMERLLRLEIANVKKAIVDIEKKHESLIQLDIFKKLSLQHMITLEDIPGTWRNNEFINSKKVVVFHYGDDKKTLNCIVLDSIQKNIRIENDYTRKILRLYYPNVQAMELETSRDHYHNISRLDKTSPEVQLKALRFVFLQLRTALYTMDMMIAAYHDKRNKLNYWQIDL